jgi:hypothetical protein
MEWQQGIFGDVILTANFFLERIDEEEKEQSMSPLLTDPCKQYASRDHAHAPADGISNVPIAKNTRRNSSG